MTSPRPSQARSQVFFSKTWNGFELYCWATPSPKKAAIRVNLGRWSASEAELSQWAKRNNFDLIDADALWRATRVKAQVQAQAKVLRAKELLT